MAFILRPAVLDDISAMHIIRMSVTENILSDSRALQHADYLPFLGDIGETWVAVSGENLAGFVALDRTISSVWALFVSPEFESKGFGKALLNQIVERARACHINVLQLATTPNTRAERFYYSQGWQAAGPAPNGEIALRLVLSA